MSGFWSVRRLAVGAFVMAAAVGTAGVWAQTTPAPAPLATPPAIPPGPNLATINGKEVNREAFNAIMIQVAGMRVFQQVFDLTIVQQACMNAGIPMQGDEYTKRIQDEINRTLDSFTITQPANGALSKDEELKQRQMLLGQVLQQRGVTAVEWRMGLDTSAGLRELSKGKIAETTDKEAQTAYDAQYGERRSVHIMVLPADQKDAATLSASYRKAITEDKKTPEQAAAELKQGQPASWTISKNATEVPDIYAVAFNSLKKPGEISAITTVKQEGQPEQKVIVLLDKVEEDRTKTSPYNDTLKKELKDKVFAAKQQEWMNRQLQVLRGNASVDIKDPILKDQFDQIAAQMRANAAAATAPATGASGTAPASAPGGMAPATPGTTLPGGLIPKN